MDSISQEYGAAQAATGLAQPEPVVRVRGLVKRYGSHEAVAGIDLEVRRGTVHLPQVRATGWTADALAEIQGWTAGLPDALDRQDRRIAAGQLRIVG